ncbi:MAG: DinB family protein [Streptosporangiaceae bacterium]
MTTAWTAPPVSRAEPPEVVGEREALQGWLDYHRQTLLHKCAGLTGEQLTARAAAPSSLSLLGLVWHMAEVERAWFRRRLGRQPDLPLLYCDDERPDGDFDLAEAAGAEADFAAFLAECELADEEAGSRSLDETFPSPRDGTPMDLRWVYLHMIEEYARHNGHADILREQIDGVTGD